MKVGDTAKVKEPNNPDVPAEFLGRTGTVTQIDDEGLVPLYKVKFENPINVGIFFEEEIDEVISKL